MQKNIRWGILGLGGIAHKFAQALPLVKDAELAAVASRSLQKAQEFGENYQVITCYGSYEQLWNDNSIDVIYIATPHSFHYPHTLQCLEHGKAVLCEKPFAMQKAQVQGMIALAQQKKVFLMEAFWTKFLPAFQKAKELIRDGVIGEIQMVQAHFGFKAPYDPQKRLFNKNLGGGALLDIGIYPLFMASAFLGKPDRIQATQNTSDTGIDAQCSMLLTYTGGQMAVLSASFMADSPIEANLCGSEGTIRMTSPFHTAEAQIEVYKNRKLQEVISPDVTGNGYNYEAQEVVNCLQTGKIESGVMTHQDSLELIDLLDWVQREAGINYHLA